MRANGPAHNRRMVQSMVILTILAWATHTLLSQWGWGAEVDGVGDSGELFIASNQSVRCARLEIQAEAITSTSPIKLKQIVRWPGGDGLMMELAAEVVVARMDKNAKSQMVDIDQIKAALEAAGVNLSLLSFCGSQQCNVQRSAVWMESVVLPATPPASAGGNGEVVRSSAWVGGQPAPASERPAPRTLREILTNELAERFQLSAESLQLKFGVRDEKLVGLSEPLFRFEVEPRRQRNIGDITWDVAIITDSQTQNVSITANVQMWQTQLVTNRPMAFKQIFGEQDVVQKRILVDHLSDGLPLALRQVVGQQAARDIGAGVPLTNAMVEAVQLVRMGELVDVDVAIGAVRIKWVAEARESGACGQTIRVRKPQEREEFFVTVTGPKQASLSGLDRERQAAVSLAR